MTDIKNKAVGGEDTPLPILDFFLADANTLYEGGRILWTRRDTGFAQNSTYALANPTNVICWGIVSEHLDNTTPLGGAPVNSFNNPGTSGVVRGRYVRGVFLLIGDGTVLQSSVGLPVYLVSDVTPTGNSLAVVSLSSLAGARPLVGYVTTNPRGATENPDPSKIPVAIGLAAYPAGIPAGLQVQYVDDPTVHTAPFTVVPGVMHIFNFQVTGNINFPAVSALIDGQQLALLNQGTGSTASTLVGPGTTNIGFVAAGTTAATAAGPKSLTPQTYVANNTLGSWIPGL